MSNPWDGLTAIYVRAAASGANNGTNWTDAFTALPSTLTRNRVYYVGKGTYAGYDFTTTKSGTTMVYVVKATDTDHGGAGDWSSTFGNAEALFTSSGRTLVFKYNTGYLWWDGQYGTHGSAGSFGFRFYCTGSRNTGDTNVGIENFTSPTGDVHNLTLRYCEVDWNNGTAAGTAGATRGIALNNGGSPVGNGDITIDHCWIHHSSGFGIYSEAGGDNLTISNTRISNCGGASGGSAHHELIWCRFTDNFQYYGNELIDAVSGDLTGWLMMGALTNAHVYNNLWYSTDPASSYAGGNGFCSTWSDPTNICDGVTIEFNTFANLPTGGGGILWDHSSGSDTNIVIQNNIFRTADLGITGATTNQYNAFGGGATASGTNQQTGLATSIFTDWAGFNFHLASHTTAGLTSTVTTDKDGVTRSAPDRGAYELNAGGGGRGTATGAWIKA